MIVISRSLVLAEVQTYPADNPVIGWHNVVTPGRITASSEAADYPAINLANPNTSLQWRAADTAAQSIVILTEEIEPIDYIGIARHNFGSAGIALLVEGRASVVDSFTELVQEFIPPDDSPLTIRFAPQALYEVKITFATGSAALRAAVLYVGKLLVMERGLWVDHTPLKYGRRQNVLNGRAESGDFLGRIVKGEWRESPAKFQHLDPDWYREFMEPFLDVAQEEPFFFAWRPQTYPRESGFAVLVNDAVPVPEKTSHLYEIELLMRGIP